MPDSDLKVHEDLKVDTSHGDHERFAHYVDKNDMMKRLSSARPSRRCAARSGCRAGIRRSSPCARSARKSTSRCRRRRRRKRVVVGRFAESAASVLNPDLPALRGWQKAAYAEYFRVAKRDFLLVATPGAGKTAYALTIAKELLTRREILAVTIVTPTEHLKYQWAQAAKRFGIAIDPSYRNAQGKAGRRLPRRRRHLRAGRRAPGAAQGAHGEPHDAGHLRRGPPRGRRAVLGRRREGGVRPGQAQARADRDAVQVGREPDPFRHLRPGGGRVQAVRLRLRLRLRARAGRRRGAAGDLPRLLRRDALAHQGGRRDQRDPGHAHDQGPDRAGLADGARPGRRLDPAGARGRGQAAHRGAAGNAGRGRPGDRLRPRDGARLRGAAAQDQRRAARRGAVRRPHREQEDLRVRRSRRRAGWSRCAWCPRAWTCPRLAVGVYATSVSTPLFFAQAVGRFVRARKRGETASVFVPSVPTLLGFAAELEAERDHVVRSLDRDPEAELEEAQRERKTQDDMELFGRSIEVLKASATFDRVLFDGGEFGTATEAGSPEEEDYLGLPGLLEPDQVTTLLRKRQAAQLAARSAATAAAQDRRARRDGGLFAVPGAAAAKEPSAEGADGEPRAARRAPQGAERPGRRLVAPHRPAARRNTQRAAQFLRRPRAPAGVRRADQGADRQDPPVGPVPPLIRPCPLCPGFRSYLPTSAFYAVLDTSVLVPRWLADQARCPPEKHGKRTLVQSENTRRCGPWRTDALTP